MSRNNISGQLPFFSTTDRNSFLEATRHHALSHPILTLALTLLALSASYLFALIYFPKTGIWAQLPGPKRISWFIGNPSDAHKGQGKFAGQLRQPRLNGEGDDMLQLPGVFNAALLEDFDSDVVVSPRPVGGEILVTRDPASMNHILADSFGYQRNPVGTKATKILIGDGIVAVFGDEHKKQRKMVGPAFSVDHLRALVPTFWDLTIETCDQIERDLDFEPKFGKDVKEVVKWFGRATLDIIGKTGFDYDFQAVSQGPNGMSVRNAFHAAMTSSMNIGAFDAIVGGISFFVLPSIHFLPVTDNVRKVLEMRSELIKTSQKIVTTKARQIREEMQVSGGQGGETFAGKKDILHLCMKANMSPDVREADRLSDETLAGQIVTFIFAGHETTATTLSWCLYFLAMHQELQDELRDSIYAALKQTGTALDDLTSLGWNEINSAPFKKVENALVETLRLRPPVSTTYRTAFKEDRIPVTNPVLTKDGRKLTSIPVQPGSEIALSITGNCLDEKYFGPETHLFKPSRWENLPEAHAKAKMPPPWGFFVFNGGPKVCIGNRFAMTEMKIVLIQVLLRWRVEPVPGIKLKSIEAVVQRPAVVGRESEGSQLPLKFIKI